MLSLTVATLLLITSIVMAMPNRDATDSNESDILNILDEYIVKVAEMTANEAKILNDVRNYYNDRSSKSLGEFPQSFLPRGGKRDARPRAGK
uniref:Hym-355 preprohormone n=1 Tax=Hydra vulgaris TaxID=6087 RepID=Q9U8U7_HYDVU|nr:uncharacterized protein LOC105844853 [Hydra vulgaris]BAA85005.1 Hym-355 preprohormone [Hydra vulgaris]